MNEVDKVKVEKEHKAVTQPTSKQLPAWFPWVAAGLVALLVALVGYAIGQRSPRTGMPAGVGFNDGMMRGGYNNDRNFSGQSFRGRGMMAGSVGEVTAVSADSITIKDTMRGGSVNYKIDASTKVTEGGDTKAVSDIKTGNTVRVAATGTDTTIATEITLGTN